MNGLLLALLLAAPAVSARTVAVSGPDGKARQLTRVVYAVAP